MPSDLSAILVPDRGESAASPNFFRSPAFLRAEGVTHTLSISGHSGELVRLPVIVRPIPGTDRFDAISPYGFPGTVTITPGIVDPLQVDWSATKLVSVFIRSKVGEAPSFSRASLRGNVQVVDPSLPIKVRRNHRCDIRRNESLGFTTRCVPGPETTPEHRQAFVDMYLETMARNGAQPWYFFSREYIDAILSDDVAWLVLTCSSCDIPAAGIVMVYSDEMLHSYLSGTANQYLKNAPGKNTFGACSAFAEQTHMPLNLGGGARPGDSLEHFKMGFANTTLPFYTHEIVCDAEAYHDLTKGIGQSDFFPLYRAAE